MAKTYLQVHQNGKLVVVDQAKTIGGSWAKERLYLGLKTNNVFGSYEFGDFPMVPEKYGAKGLEHIPGEVVHAYFCDVAAHYCINSNLRLETKVQSATLQEDGRWAIKLKPINAPHQRVTILVATKLVLATGLTSKPYIPIFPGQEDFGVPILHSKELKQSSSYSSILQNCRCLGWNKSAWDACYSAAMSGSRVHMVIRPSGGGPSYLWPRSFSWGPFNLSLALLSGTRLFIPFGPTPYGKIGPFAFLRYLLHRTHIGQRICQFLWNRLDLHIKKLNRYNTSPELQKLEPWTIPFWIGNSLSIHNYDTNWFDLVREGRVSIHIVDLTSLSKGRINLSSNETLDADALVCCTGWLADPAIQFNSSSVTAGVPVRTKLADNDPKLLAAEREINNDLRYLPSLPRRTANAPLLPGQVSEHSSSLYQPYRIVIPSQRIFLEKKNIAFIGSHSSVHAILVAQAQALWITAFFQDKVKHLSGSELDFETVEYNSILDSIYGKLRRPKESGGAAGKYPDLVFDSLPYVDTLLRDLGLVTNRKSNWWKEIFECYRPQDYRGMIEEWVRKESNTP